MFDTTFKITALLGSLLAGAQAAQAGSFTALYSLPGGIGPSGPVSGLVARGDKLFGTTSQGGLYGNGTAYQFNLATRHVADLYDFSEDALGPGFSPSAQSLTLAGANAYGVLTTGIGTGGSVYRLNTGSGALTTVTVFADQLGLYTPNGVILSGGMLYGTSSGGTRNGHKQVNGAVFSVNPTTGTATALHEFDGADGSGPVAQLVAYGGALFGTTEAGGAANDGVVFRVDPHSGDETVVHSFAGRADGAGPTALIRVGSVLYGTTTKGGAHGAGTVFSLDIATGTLTTLHSFAAATEGGDPYGGMVMLGGQLYGTTLQGGRGGQGTLFRVDPASGAFAVLHAFAGKADGGMPVGALLAVQNLIYGTAMNGGAGYGTIFEYAP